MVTLTYTREPSVYLELMRKLVESEVSPSEFSKLYMEQWEIDRDNGHAFVAIPEIQNALSANKLKFHNHEISSEEYDTVERAILNVTEFDLKIIHITDIGYTTCDVYWEEWEDPPEEEIKKGWILDDQGLIKTIAGLYQELKELVDKRECSDKT
jgi:hypothetical protein